MPQLKNYQIHCQYSEEDACYLAYIEELEGCIADGETPDEAKENVLRLAEEWMVIAQENGWNIPLPKEKAK